MAMKASYGGVRTAQEIDFLPGAEEVRASKKNRGKKEFTERLHDRTPG